MPTPRLKIVVERHPDGFVAYPLGLQRGAIVGQGDTYDEALADVRSAIAFYIESVGPGALAISDDETVLEAFIAESAIPG